MVESDKRDTIKKKLLVALEKSMGIVSIACKKVKISRQTFYRYCQEDPEFDEKVKDIGEMAIDFVESKLLTNISQGAETSIIFFLKTKGKKRGYSEKEAVVDPSKNNNTSIGLTFTIVDPKNNIEINIEDVGANEETI